MLFLSFDGSVCLSLSFLPLSLLSFISSLGFPFLTVESPSSVNESVGSFNVCVLANVSSSFLITVGCVVTGVNATEGEGNAHKNVMCTHVHFVRCTVHWEIFGVKKFACYMFAFFFYSFVAMTTRRRIVWVRSLHAVPKLTRSILLL